MGFLGFLFLLLLLVWLVSWLWPRMRRQTDTMTMNEASMPHFDYYSYPYGRSNYGRGYGPNDL